MELEVATEEQFEQALCYPRMLFQPTLGGDGYGEGLLLKEIQIDCQFILAGTTTSNTSNLSTTSTRLPISGGNYILT